MTHARLTATLAASMATHVALLFAAAALSPRASLLPPLMVELAAGAPAPEPPAPPVARAPRVLTHRPSTVAGRTPGARVDAAPDAAAAPRGIAEPAPPPPRAEPSRVAADRTSEPLPARPETPEPPPRADVAAALPPPPARVQITAPSVPAVPPAVQSTSPPAQPMATAEQPATTPPSGHTAAPAPPGAAAASGPSAALGVGDTSIGGSDSGGARAGASGRGSGGQGPSAAIAPGDGGIAGDGGREYAGYLGLIRTKIQQALQYPPAARRRSLSGTVQLEILVEPTGVIERASIIGGSAHPVLDEAVLATVRSLPPIPFPPSLPPRPLRARLPIVFELQ